MVCKSHRDYCQIVHLDICEGQCGRVAKPGKESVQSYRGKDPGFRQHEYEPWHLGFPGLKIETWRGTPYYQIVRDLAVNSNDPLLDGNCCCFCTVADSKLFHDAVNMILHSEAANAERVTDISVGKALRDHL
jgi:hypothetical protein